MAEEVKEGIFTIIANEVFINTSAEYIPLDLNNAHEEEHDDRMLDNSNNRQDDEDDKSENEHHVGKDNSVYVVRICH